MAIIGKDLELACDLLKRGQVVAIPTETVYGLAGNAMDSSAIAKIYAVKNRPANNPLIVHIGHMDQLFRYSDRVPAAALKLAEKFWPGPLTLLLPRTAQVIDAVTAGLPHVAIRMPAHPLALELLNKLPFALAAPSANPYGYISPTDVTHVNSQLGDKIDYIVDGGPCSRGLESTIVGFENGVAVIYRKGVITLDDIQKVTGEAKLFQKNIDKPVTSGMSLSHYSPQTPVYLIRSVDLLHVGDLPENFGLLTFKRQYPITDLTKQVVLCPSGNMEEAAKNLYEALHRLDGMQLDLIVAECAPEEGIGVAINDRLTRAAHKIITG